MTADIDTDASRIIANYDPAEPGATADRLRALWLGFEPKSIVGIKAELRAQQETVGIPVAVLKSIGRQVGKTARQRVVHFLPLARLLWTGYGREGRVVALIALGAMELARPELIIPLLRELGQTCITWEDADRLAMDALEPIVRKQPERWLAEMEPWLSDDSKWIRRAAIIVVGRLPMKHPGYASRCLELCERLLTDGDTDVKKAVSFAIRLVARGDLEQVRSFLARTVPPHDPRATWVLCDAIRSMTSKFLPQLASLLPLYRDWAADPSLSSVDRRSVESAVTKLERAHEQD